MKQLIAFGEALVDMLSSRVEGSRANQDSHANQDSGEEQFTKYAGGAPANVAVAVAKLGGRSYFAGKVGADMFGDFLEGQLKEAGVNTGYLKRTSDAKTALAFVSLDARGERSFSFYRSPSADMLFTCADFRHEWFGPPGIFHFCSNTLTEPGLAAVTRYGAQLARDAGWLVSFDVNLRTNLWPEHADAAGIIRDSLRQAQLVKMSEEEFDFLADTITPAALVDELLGSGVQLLVVTRGGQALSYYTPSGSGRVQPPAVTMVDSTAAGDAFVGGMLFQLTREEMNPLYDLLRGKSQDDSAAELRAQAEQCLAFACACGAHAVQRKGAFSALARADDIGAVGKG